jgi:serine/threonine protein kinase/tetratricopeptide (TPR) repeat protein
LAEDTRLDRKVALKFLLPHLCQDEECRARFQREAQAAAKLSHPNIVHIYEVSDFQGRPFFAMEYVEGPSLRDIIKKGERLSLDKIIDFAIQTCEGLGEAHAAGIVHRDIKPSNILLDIKDRPKLVDFGLAAVRGVEPITKVGSTLGTIGYMAPEQVKGEKTDNRTDLFSLGILLYELTAGRAPFRGENDAAILKSILEDTPEPLDHYRPDIPKEISQVVSTLLKKDPSERYQRTEDFLPILKSLKKPQSDRGPAPVSRRSFKWALGVGIGAVVTLIALAIYIFLPRGKSTEGMWAESLVVLPFENLGDPEDDYFADGITDEITARIAGISGLRVTSRTSAMQYKNSQKSLGQIGKELDVNYALEGTIRWDKSGDTDRIRIIPQLIRISDDAHIWAGTFERALTRVFTVQAEIAAQIAEALDVTLLESEQSVLESQPAINQQAYNYYLRGKEYWDRIRTEDRAIQMFEKAVEHDTTFYQAYAMLAQIYGYTYINNIDRTEKRFAQAKDAAERAFRLAGGKAEGHLAMGYFHYYCSRDYGRAMEQFEMALEGQPNNSELLAAIAYVRRRQGRWDEAVENLRRVLKLDPLSLGTAESLIRTLFYMHKIKDAETVLDNTLTIAPDSQILLIWKTFLTALAGPDTSEVRAALNRAEQFAERSFFNYWAEQADIYLRDYRSALKRRPAPESQEPADLTGFYLAKGEIYRYLGESDLSREYYDSARVIYERMAENQPEDASHLIGMATAYAGLGRAEDAVREGRRATELLPVSEDALTGTSILASLANIYILAGEYETAIDLLDSLLSIPSMVQVEQLRQYQVYDPLRDHPRFQALLNKYGEKQ